MKYRTIKILGGTVMFALVAEATPHFDMTEPCIGTAEEMMLCGPSERMLDRRLDHTPESEFDAFGGWPMTYVASGAVNSVSTSTSSSQSPLRYNPGGTLFIGSDR